MTAAVGAIHASGAMRGLMPANAKSGPWPWIAAAPRKAGASSGMGGVVLGNGSRDAVGQAEHKQRVLHRGPRSAFAEIIEPRHQHGLPARLVAEDEELN